MISLDIKTHLTQPFKIIRNKHQSKSLTKMIQQQMNDVSVRAIDDFSNIDSSIQWIKNHMIDFY